MRTNAQLSPSDKLTKARAKLLYLHPFFADLAYRLTPVATNRFPLGATDGVNLYYNPEYIDKVTVDDTLRFYAHEVLHPAQHHHTRRRGRNPELYNVAADHVVNLILKACGFLIPEEWYCDARFEGKSVDEVCQILDEERRRQEQQKQQQDQQDQKKPDQPKMEQPKPEQPKSKPKQDQQKPAPQQKPQQPPQSPSEQPSKSSPPSSPQTQGQGKPQNKPQGQQERKQQPRGGQGSPQQGQGQNNASVAESGGQETKTGSGPGQPGKTMQPGQSAKSPPGQNKNATQPGTSDPQPDPSWPKDNDPRRPGDVIDYKGDKTKPGSKPEQAAGQPATNENEKRQAEQDWKCAVAQAYRAAKKRGKMPGALEEFIKEIIEPKIDWRDVLRHFLERIARNDYSWEVFDRRYMSSGFLLPDLYSQELGDIVIASDTSCSRSKEMLQQDASEISAIFEQYEATIHVVYVDSKVQGHKKYTREDLPLDLHFPGRGGTRFIPAFEWVKEQGLQPSCLIYLTDMECHRFPEEPDYKVLWIQNGKYDNPPPFGELVRM